MIIGIDGNEANVLDKVGISEYAYQLLTQFAKFTHSKLSGQEIQNAKFKIYLKNTHGGHLPEENDKWEYRVVKPSRLWTQMGLPIDLYIHKPRPDIFFSPTHYAPRFCPVPSVISIMDTSYLHFPKMFKKSDLYQLRSWTSYSVRKAAKIITISKSSKDDIINQYHIPESRVKVVYLGIKDGLNGSNSISMDKLKDKYLIANDFILFVGTLQPRKNIARLIEAFSRIAAKKKDLNLVIIGKKGWLYDEILASPEKHNVSENVKFLDFVSDEELTTFYKHALCYVLPSLYEGFGLPVLEAMKYGCPVITSNSSSLPEAGGDAALYFDPENVDNMASTLEKVIKDPSLRKEMKEKGYKQVKKFSWEKTASEVLEVLKQVAAK